jgi:hypothetical protein
VPSGPRRGPRRRDEAAQRVRGTARGRGVAREGDNVTVTMPDEKNAGSDRDAQPLGSEVAPPGDPESQGGEPGPADGVAGPSYPPAGTEPDAH